MLRFVLAMAAASAASAGSAAPVAVTGATGKLGRHAVKRLVEQGERVRCLVRCDPAPAASGSGKEASKAEVAAWLAALPGVELVKELLRGCKACLALHGATRFTKLQDFLSWVDESLDANHARQVNCEAVSLLLEAAEAQNCQRLVRVTGKGEEPWSIPSILINGLGSMAKAWNQEGERRLRSSSVDYTIVRPGFMGDVDAELEEPRALALADDGGDLKVTAIPHRCVADLCVQSLSFPNCARATLVAMTQPGPGPRTWDVLLEKVRPDRRAFPGAELLSQHYLAVRSTGALLAFGLVAVLSLARRLF
ncbi:unnamed protein product [Effrenium voratum]|nr:unnamed protein product [Effrenium voratum]